jgi:hypothetical protein
MALAQSPAKVIPLRLAKFCNYAIFLLAMISVSRAEAQTSGSDYLRQSISGGFVYEWKVGPDSQSLPSAPGFSINYSFRPRRWLAIEAGLEQIPRPIGSGYCCEYVQDINDELYLVPFGVRYVWEPEGGPVRLSAGGGGAYLKYTVGSHATGAPDGFSGWGGQVVVSGDYGLTRSGRFRVGVTGRYYYVPARYSLPSGLYPPGYNASAPIHILAIGPEFTFSFR